MKITEWLDSPSTGWYCEGSWRDWFVDVLDALFAEGEGFSGKRPGKNDSDWETILAHSLIDAGLLKGTRTDHGPDDYDYEFDWNDYRRTMRDVVRALVFVATNQDQASQ